METLRIAILTENLPPARLNLQPWRYLGDLAQALQALGHIVSVVTGEGELQEWNGVRVEGHAPVSDFRSASTLRALVAARGFDAGIFRLTAGLFFSLRREPRQGPSAGRLAGVFLRPLHGGRDLARRFLDPRLVPEVRLDAHHPAMFASRLLGTWPLAPSFVNHFVFLWESDLRCATAAGLPADSCSVVSHPFDPFFQEVGPSNLGPRLSDILSPSPRRIVFSGPPEEARGIHEVLRLPHVLPREPRVQVVLLLRDGAYAVPSATRTRIGPHELLIVRGLVTRDELRAVYRQSHVAVFPYRFVRTGLPLVALEAAAAGLPVVTTRVHPIRELEGRTGLVFANARDPRDLARAIQSTFEDERVHAIRRRNAEWIRSTPDWRAVARAFVTVLRA